MNGEGFLQRIRKYTDIRELTPDILHSIMDEIVVRCREQRLADGAESRKLLQDNWLRGIAEDEPGGKSILMCAASGAMKLTGAHEHPGLGKKE